MDMVTEDFNPEMLGFKVKSSFRGAFFYFLIV
jgi:hypothetical protein